MKKHTAAYLKAQLIDTLETQLHVQADQASDAQFYKAAALVLREQMSQHRKRFRAASAAAGRKQVYYLSMEFLMGRSLKNAVYNMELLEPLTEALGELGVRLEGLYDYEPDPGLGNGGLGRLAACYLDALATLEYPAMGYSILYEYGIFKQQIIDGWQTELPDYWLPGGEVWLEPLPEHTVEVRFGGEVTEYWDNNYHHMNHTNYSTVLAMPYNMYVPGYGSKGVSVLRLWKAKSPGIDMELFNKGDYLGAFGSNSLGEAISKVLYPNDSHTEGKNLRLRQQYFLVCASVSDIVRRHMSLYGGLDNFAQKNAIHINDTHPTLAIPELMRVLLDDCGYNWDAAWDIVTRTFAYTNHTVMAEALESWNEEMLRAMLPRIHQIICEINRRFCLELEQRHRLDQHTIARMSIVQNHQIRMVNLAVAGSHSVNGVSALHSEIVKNSLLADFSAITPYKFKNVTNGIAARRWLLQANPRLTGLIKELIGDGFLKDFSRLRQLDAFAEKPEVHRALAEVKLKNKENFCDWLARTTGEQVDPTSIFDVQVKRLHEYKRQHLNALDILSTYLALKENPGLFFVPRTYIFGAKAAPGYYLAKQIIKFICALRDLIAADPVVSQRMRIVFLEEYNVSLSELLMPAAEISQQISLAGTEASGTGNMKLMLSGAITLGTLDGANVEIAQAAGAENQIIFGMTTSEVQALAQRGYAPLDYYLHNPDIKRCVDFLTDTPGVGPFTDIAATLKNTDRYMALADFEAYKEARARSAKLYSDLAVWQKMSLHNIAAAGVFCADRAVEEYARNIWGLGR